MDDMKDSQEFVDWLLLVGFITQHKFYFYQYHYLSGDTNVHVDINDTYVEIYCMNIEDIDDTKKEQYKWSEIDKAVNFINSNIYK